MDRPIEFNDVVAGIEARAGAEAAIDRLAVAADETQRLTKLADRVLGHYVSLARSQAVSWTEIGNALGTSKQAAQQRFPHPSHAAQTRSAYTALVTAEAEAMSLGHNYIGTEHILLALVRTDEGAASRVLRQHGVTPEVIEQQTKAVIGPANGSCLAPLGWTPRARRIAKLAGKHARRTGCRRTQSGHLLLAIMDQRDSVAAKVLDRLEVDVHRIREEVVRSVPTEEH